MELKEGYKQTEVGVIPEDWELHELPKLYSIERNAAYSRADTVNNGPVKYLHYGDIHTGLSGLIQPNEIPEEISKDNGKGYYLLNSGDVVLADASEDIEGVGAAVEIFNPNNEACIAGLHTIVLSPRSNQVALGFGALFAKMPIVGSQFRFYSAGLKVFGLSKSNIKKVTLPLPPIQEQRAIAEVLSDVDAEIESLAQRHEKLVAQKQGLSEELLSGRTRLVEPKSKGFKQTEVGVIPEDWELTTIDASCSILDNQRIPLNSNERLQRQGVFPYCGANGILDFVDDFLIDDEVVLLAEDGGQFDEFKTRPICYHFKGKFWPNNHVHVLKGGAGLETKYLFFHFEHKDITPFINGGTRSKLNQGDMREIKFSLPPIAEQQAIAEVLSDVDAEIQAVVKLKAKVQAKKEGLMQTLLTGKIRLT